MRANVLEALIQSPPIIRSQLVECMKVGGLTVCS